MRQPLGIALRRLDKTQIRISKKDLKCEGITSWIQNLDPETLKCLSCSSWLVLRFLQNCIFEPATVTALIYVQMRSRQGLLPLAILLYANAQVASHTTSLLPRKTIHTVRRWTTSWRQFGSRTAETLTLLFVFLM